MTSAPNSIDHTTRRAFLRAITAAGLAGSAAQAAPAEKDASSVHERAMALL